MKEKIIDKIINFVTLTITTIIACMMLYVAYGIGQELNENFQINVAQIVQSRCEVEVLIRKNEIICPIDLVYECKNNTNATTTDLSDLTYIGKKDEDFTDYYLAQGYKKVTDYFK